MKEVKDRELSIGDRINLINVVATLVVSVATFWVSLNTYYLSEHLNEIGEKQSEFELRNSILSLITQSSMLRQQEANPPIISNCIGTYREMKMILESQMKNSSLIQKEQLAQEWQDLLMTLNFQIKFLEPCLEPNHICEGVHEKISQVDSSTSRLFQL